MRSTNSRNSLTDALLVHAYWFNNESDNSLDEHGNLQLLAASCLLKETEVDKVVILGGTINPKKESLGKVMQKELSQRLNKKLAKKLFVAPNSLSLRQEVRNFQKLVKKNNWHNIAGLCVNTQLPRVKRAYKRIFGKEFDRISFLTAEEVLVGYGYKKEAAKYNHSIALKALKVYEALVGTIDRIPVIGGYLIDTLIKIFPWKGVVLSKIFSVKKTLV